MEKRLRVVKTEAEIQQRVKELAQEIREVTNVDTMVVGLLDDVFVFLADLIRAMEVPLTCYFMKVNCQEHAGSIDITYTSEFDPRGLDLLLVSAVTTTGLTLDYVSRQMGDRNVRSLHTCSLLDKPAERRVDINPDFVGFKIDEPYVFGYGLGMQNKYRNLPYLAAFEEE